MLRAGQGRGRRGMGGEPWYLSPQYAGMPGIADFNLDRFALPSLGPDFARNGTFDGLANWTISFDGAQSNVNGRLRVTSNGGPATPRSLQSYTNLEAGELYEITVDGFSNVGGAGAQILVTTSTNGSNAGLISQVNVPAGTQVLGQKVYFVAPAVPVYVALWSNSSTTGNYAEFDNYSIRKVIPNQLRAATREEWEANFKASASDPNTRLKMDQSGVFTGTPADKFRIDWSTGKPQLIVQSQSTNYLPRNRFIPLNAGGWGASSGSSYTTVPTPYGDGGYEFFEATTAIFHTMTHYPAISGVAGDVWCESLYIKPTGRTVVTIQNDAVGFNSRVDFNFVTKVAVRSNPAIATDAGIVELANGWFFIWAQFTAQAAYNSVGWKMYPFSGGQGSYQGDGRSCYIGFAPQIEKNSSPTSRIFTDGAAVTRAVETFNLPPILQALMDKGGYIVADETGANIGQANGAATMIKRDARYNFVALKAAA